MKKAKKEDQMPVDRKCLDVVLRFVTSRIQEKEKPQKQKKKRLQFFCFGESIKPNFSLVTEKLCTLGVGRWPKSETAFFGKRKGIILLTLEYLTKLLLFEKGFPLVSRKIQPLTFYNISPLKRQPLGGWYNYCIFM